MLGKWAMKGQWVEGGLEDWALWFRKMNKITRVERVCSFGWRMLENIVFFDENAEDDRIWLQTAPNKEFSNALQLTILHEEKLRHGSHSKHINFHWIIGATLAPHPRLASPNISVLGMHLQNINQVTISESDLLISLCLYFWKENDINWQFVT